MKFLNSQHLWIDRFLLNSANSFAIDDLESHVAIFAPAWAPWVLHDPVFSSVFFSIANDKGGVVKFGTALVRIEDPTRVLLEDCLVSRNWDRDRLLTDSILHLLNVVRSDVSIDWDANIWGIIFWVSACSVSCSVGIVRFEISIVRFPVVEGLELPSATTTVATRDAVN